MIRKIIVFTIFMYLSTSIGFSQCGVPGHELLGLVDKTTGIGVPDARCILTTYPMSTNIAGIVFSNLIGRVYTNIDTNYMAVIGGATLTTTNRVIGQGIIYKGTNNQGRAIYEHEWFSTTNAYAYFFKQNNTNILRFTDGSTQKYDIAFSTGPLPSNGIPLLSITNSLFEEIPELNTGWTNLVITESAGGYDSTYILPIIPESANTISLYINGLHDPNFSYNILDNTITFLDGVVPEGYRITAFLLEKASN